ncbi:hypothetical protein DRN87_05550 [Candidatus Geothermarchaeota archaeon]|nr:MAG: hypothetical protein DRN87_05550 [Candidatus Geothermarchaeota archaeon]HEW94109.1 hypothetical protein [Thermoprotei archaeon]
MYVIIIGGGALGFRLTKRLEIHDAVVTVIEKNPDRCDEILTKTKAHVIKGDATDPRILEEADIEKADYVVAVTGDDRINILVGLIAQNYGVENVIVRVEHSIYEEIAKQLGLTYIINPSDTAATILDAVIRGIKFIEFFKIEDKHTDVEEVNISKKSKYYNKPISYLVNSSKDMIHPIMVVRNGEILIPEKDLTLKEGDVVWILRKRRKFLF